MNIIYNIFIVSLFLVNLVMLFLIEFGKTDVENHSTKIARRFVQFVLCANAVVIIGGLF